MTKWLVATAALIGSYTVGVNTAEGVYKNITRDNSHAVEVCQSRYKRHADVVACIKDRLTD